MTSPCIFLSRRGYAYQDKYALLKFMESFCNGDLQDFYVDWPFGDKGKSLDILVVTRALKHIYEVKTGDKFKRDKYKELGQALRSLYSYQKIQIEKSRAHLIISPELRPAVLDHWSDITFIHDEGIRAKNTRDETMESVATRCHCKFGFKDINVNLNEFIEFIKTLKLIIGHSNEKRGTIDKYSDLEDMIMSIIRDLSDKLDLVSSQFEIPDWNVTVELLEIIRQGAEGRLNIVSEITKALVDSFGRRSLFATNIGYPTGVSNDNLLLQEKAKISRKLFEISRASYEGTPALPLSIEGGPME